LPRFLPPFVLALASCLSGACHEASPDMPGPDASTSDAAAADAGGEEDAEVHEAVTCARMDVLFVIDNSESMAQEQANLGQNFDRFVDSLRMFREGTVDFRIGVTTMSFPQSFSISPPSTTSGALLKTPEMTDPWLSHDDPELASKFRALATVGTDGSWDEQPLKAMGAALVDRVADGQNKAFFRSNALLAVVIVTDEDDLSSDGPDSLEPGKPTPVGTFVTLLDRIKRNRDFWSAAVIAGGTAPTCDSAFGTALFAARLQAFVDQAGDNSTFSSICEGDLSGGLDAALATFRHACDDLVL
jgi:hypothetical protein